MPFDDATVPMQPINPPAPPARPIWPAQGPQTPTPPPAFAPSATKRRPNLLAGCGLALALVSAFVIGVALSAIVMSVLFLPAPTPAVSTTPTGALVKVTLTDAFMNKAMNASNSGALAQTKSHIGANGEITISGVLQGTPIASGKTAVIVLAPKVSNGALNVTIISGAVNGFPIPAFTLSPIASQINSQLAKSSAIPLGGSQQLTIKGLTFADGQMTISYA